MTKHQLASLLLALLGAETSWAFVVPSSQQQQSFQLSATLSPTQTASQSKLEPLTAGGDSNPPVPQYTDPAFWNPKCKNYVIMDWDKWDALNPKPPRVYDPVQFYEFEGKKYRPTYWYHRTPIADDIKNKIGPEEHRFDKLTDVSLYSNLLHPSNPDCPDVLKGVFWMRDNVLAPETVTSFQNWAWKSNAAKRGGMVGMGSLKYNWSHDPTNYGAGFITATQNAVGGVQMHPNGKWILLFTMPNDPTDVDSVVQYFWIYVIQPGEEFVDEFGQKIDYLQPGDLLRLSWNGTDPYSCDNEKEMSYFYTPRKLAHLDEKTGNTVLHRANIDALIEKATQTSADIQATGNVHYKKPSLFGFWSGGFTARQRAELNRQEINLVQVWQQAPHPPPSFVVDPL